MLFPLLLGGAALFLLTRKGDDKAPGTGTGTGTGTGPTAPSCSTAPKLPPPPPGLGTGPAAIPAMKLPELGLGVPDLKTFYNTLLTMTPDAIKKIPAPGQQAALAAAIASCEQVGFILRCNSYFEAANMIYQQAQEMKQWKVS